MIERCERTAPSNFQKSGKAVMIAEITQYFAKERDEEPGDLAAGMTLDFITEKPAPDFCRQGVENSVPVHERSRGGYAQDTEVGWSGRTGSQGWGSTSHE